MTNNTLRVPPVVLGTWAWGDSGETGDGHFGSTMTRSGLDEIAGRAHASGLAMWDTAVVYGMGRSEMLLGEVLKSYARSEYQLSTKFTPQAAGTGNDPMAEMLEQSLSRLGTDYIDLYWIHNPADVERWTPSLIPLLKSGRVKHVGISNHSLSEIEVVDRILGDAGFKVEAVQNHYSLLYRSTEEGGVHDYCHRRGIPFFAYMVLEQGALTGTYSPSNPLPDHTNRAKAYNPILPRLEPLTHRLASIGRKQGASVSDVAIAWAISKGVTPLVGVTKPAHIDGLVRARTIALSIDEIAELETLADAAQVDTRGWWEKPR